MNISATAAHGATRAAAPITISASGWIGSPVGSLSRKELGALRAAVGYDFAWPPTADGPVPMAAIVVAGRHADEFAAGMKMKELTARDLQQLGAAGLLDAKGVARGIAYLEQGAAEGDSATPVGAAAVVKPASGSVAGDGSVYL